MANPQQVLEATPNADMALEIMAALDKAASVVAHQIVTQHPQMDKREVSSMVASELFYAAQDAAQALAFGVLFQR